MTGKASLAPVPLSPICTGCPSNLGAQWGRAGLWLLRAPPCRWPRPLGLRPGCTACTWLVTWGPAPRCQRCVGCLAAAVGGVGPHAVLGALPEPAAHPPRDCAARSEHGLRRLLCGLGLPVTAEQKAGSRGSRQGTLSRMFHHKCGGNAEPLLCHTCWPQGGAVGGWLIM